MKKEAVLRSFGTHDGTFHADEVTACALLLLFNLIDEDKIVRTRDFDKLQTCEYVCDVGGFYDSNKKLFDHHQLDYQGSMSSAGMILLYLKEQKILSEKEYDYFNQSLILGVDAHDNGQDPQILGLCTYSNIISSFIPIPQDVEREVMDKGFFEALHFSLAFLNRISKKFQYTHECQELVAAAMEPNQRYLLFDKSIPWLDLFFELGGEKHPAEFVVMPSGNHWKLRGIPPTYEKRMQTRVSLPLLWAGLLDEDLKKASGIPGAIFCHKGRFISVWQTKEDALKALDLVLKKD
ncbi:MAG TPA: MYG1 family protein [Parachlamydiaceae bacterium]|nr:MYG1 family protein [Parachlamydiaceae bacterium]